MLTTIISTHFIRIVKMVDPTLNNMNKLSKEELTTCYWGSLILTAVEVNVGSEIAALVCAGIAFYFSYLRFNR